MSMPTSDKISMVLAFACSPRRSWWSQSFLDLHTYGSEGIQGSHRILEYHGDFLAPYGQPFTFSRELSKVFAFKED